MRIRKRYEDEGGPGPPGSQARPLGELLRQWRGQDQGRRDVREESLNLHGLICAKCGREFDQRSRHMLTVHHKDGNWKNNPRDGSNWENLCVYCHDDEHSRGSGR